MKNYYLILVLLVSFISKAQTNCDDANSYLVNAYSHVKDAYDSNNISHLKYYANRSVESFKLSKETLIICGCKTALNLANKGIELLAKVEDVSTFEDGRFYVKRAREISKESVIEVDKCSINDYNNEEALEIDTLTELQKEQLHLKQQQDALKLKEEQINTKISQQKKNKLLLKKKQLMLLYENAILSNIKTYNAVLKICDCNHEVLGNSESSEDISTKSVEAIRNFYTNNLKTLATNYLAELNSCH
jgi:hypothetical protein